MGMTSVDAVRCLMQVRILPNYYLCRLHVFPFFGARLTGMTGMDEISCSVEFDGLIESSVRGKLIAEVLKYLVYQRQQIPQPYDQIKTELAVTENSEPVSWFRPTSYTVNVLYLS